MSVETFTVAIVAGGILAPLAAMAAAVLQQRLGGRRAVRAARIARTREEAERVAAERVARMRHDARAEMLLAEAERELQRERGAAARERAVDAELSRIFARAARPARPGGVEAGTARRAARPMAQTVHDLRAAAAALGIRRREDD